MDERNDGARLEAMFDARHEGQYRRVEVITGPVRRRNWTDEEKARMLAESAEPDANISAIARRFEHQVGSRISISGADAPIGGNALTSAALLLHELATNAAKYGALSTTEGRLEIRLDVSGDRLHMTWDERGIALAGEANHEGFGSTLERASLQGLRGELSRNWHADGLSLSLIMPLQQLLRQA